MVSSHCTYWQPWGWYCIRVAGHDGPCAARATWWNLRGKRHERESW